MESSFRAFVTALVQDEVARALSEAPPTPNHDALVTVAEAARRIAMSESFIRAAIRDGRLTAHRLGRSVRVRLSDVDALPERRRKRAAETPAQRAERILSGGRR